MSPRTALSPKEKHRRRLARYPEALRLVDEGKARPRVVEAVRHLRSGLMPVEIAEEMGVSRSRAQEWLVDPTDEKARQRKMQGNCEDCGVAIFSDRPSRSPQRRCSPCQHAHQRAEAMWHPEAIVDAIKRWAAEFGAPPTGSSWNLAQAKPEDITRFRAGRYPHYTEVVRRFGRFGSALRAAGFEPKHPSGGKARNVVTKETYREMAGMRAAGSTVPEIAECFGIKTPAAAQRLKRWKSMQKGEAMSPTTLKAETVIERELKRFEDRQAKAEQDAKYAAEQAKRLRLALSALSNGAGPE